MKDCKTTTVSVLEQADRGHCVKSDDFAVSDPAAIASHWDMSTCALAKSLDVRILVFNRSIDYASVPCCNMFIPIGWGNDFVLLDYLPVVRYEKAERFTKLKCYEVSIATPQAYDLTIYDRQYGVLIVDVRQNRVLFTGEIVKVEDFTMGTLKIRVDASVPCGASYSDFRNSLTKLEVPKPVAVMQTMHPRRDLTSLPMQDDGFIRLL
jgi:hypothetical protein